MDIFFDGNTEVVLSAPYFKGVTTHGTGCTLSAAIAAGLALGQDPYGAAVAARRYLEAALRAAPRLGRGAGPLDHFHASRSRRP